METILGFLAATFLWIWCILSVFPYLAMAATYRFLVGQIVPLFNRKVDKIVRMSDDMFLHRNPERVTAVSTALGIEGRISVAELQKEFEIKVIYKTDSKMKLTRPQMQQYPVNICRFFFWKWDASFNIKNHIKLLEIDPAWNSREKNADDILKFIETKFSNRPFPEKRSPWEVLVVPNFRDSAIHGESASTGYTGSLIVMRGHHVLGDGGALRDIFHDMCEEVGPQTKQAFQMPRLSFCQRQYLYFFGLKNYYGVMLRHLKANRGALLKSDATERKSNITTCAVTPRISLNAIKGIKLSQGVSFTAVILTLLGRAYVRFVTSTGGVVPKKMLCLTTLPALFLERKEGALLNQITMVTCELPLNNNVNCFKSVDNYFKNELKSGSPLIFFDTMRYMTLLPSFVKDRTANLNMQHLGLLTNFSLIVGERRYQGVNKVKTAFILGEADNGGAGVTCYCIGCNDSVRIVLQLDKTYLERSDTKVDTFVEYFMEELGKLTDVNKVPEEEPSELDFEMVTHF